MSVFYPHHHADHDLIVHEHGQFTDTVGDAVMRIQDEAYKLGRQRGKKEADAELLEALQIARQFMGIASDWNVDEAEINGQMRSTYDWLADVEAAIAKATGSAA